MNLQAVQSAKELSDDNFNLAYKLYKENNYHHWVVVILFYSACTLIHAICEIENIPVPERHKGRRDARSNKYIIGLLDVARRYLNAKAYSSYSFLQVHSQLLRYKPEIILKFKKDVNIQKILEQYFQEFDIILRNFNTKYGRHF